MIFRRLSIFVDFVLLKTLAPHPGSLYALFPFRGRRGVSHKVVSDSDPDSEGRGKRVCVSEESPYQNERAATPKPKSRITTPIKIEGSLPGEVKAEEVSVRSSTPIAASSATR
jgi:hypothetical protein